MLALLILGAFLGFVKGNDVACDATAVGYAVTVNGDTSSASMDANLPFCGTSITTNGIWYKISGVKDLTVDTNGCGYDTKLSLFYACNCGDYPNFQCIAGNDDGGDGLCSQVHSTPGVSFGIIYILLHGWASNTGSTPVTISGTQVDCSAGQCVASCADYACNAVPVGYNALVTASTASASYDPFLPWCGTSVTTNGVWYKIENVQDLTVETVNCAFDTKLSLFTSCGSCDYNGGFRCIGGNDDINLGAGNLCSRVTTTDAYALVYILVHGWASSTGSTELQVTGTQVDCDDDTIDCLSGCADVACGALRVNANDAFRASTEVATIDSGLPYCGGTSPTTSPGVWFRVLNVRDLTVETGPSCDYDTKLHFFTSCDCTDYSSFECVAGNDDGGDGLCSLVSTPSGIGYREVLVLLSGFGGASGVVPITFTGTDIDCVALGCETCHEGDYACDAADVTLGTTIPASTRLGTLDAGLPFCDVSVTTNGVWFRVEGVRDLVVETIHCQYDTKLTLYQSCSCNDYSSFECIAGDDDSGTGFLCSRVATPSGTAYDEVYVLLHGWGGSIGETQLQFLGTSVDCSAAGAGCESNCADLACDALSVGYDSTITGRTTSGTVDSGIPFCGTSITTNGVWYKIGSVQDLTVETIDCEYDSKLSLFGVCDCDDAASFECIAGNDDAGVGLCSLVSSPTGIAFTELYILLHGFGSSTGATTLRIQGTQVDCGSVGCFDPCAGATGDSACDATLVASLPSSQIGSTSLATLDSGLPYCGTSITTAGIWYRVVGVRDLTVETIDCEYDSKLSLFYSCACDQYEDFQCITGNDDAGVGLCSLVQTDPGVDYDEVYVLLHGFSSNTGVTEVSFTGTSVDCSAAGASCETHCADLACNAVEVDYDSLISGRTVSATVDSGLPYCGTTISAKGIWYKISNVQDLTVETIDCGYDTKLSLFTSCDCSDYASFGCIAGNDDGGVGLCSLVSTTPGTPYETVYILLHGWSSNSGESELEISGTPVDCSSVTCQGACGSAALSVPAKPLAVPAKPVQITKPVQMTNDLDLNRAAMEGAAASSAIAMEQWESVAAVFVVVLAAVLCMLAALRCCAQTKTQRIKFVRMNESAPVLRDENMESESEML